VKRPAKGAIELFEEAVYLLRRTPIAAIARYYAGALPFCLGFMFYWADMSQSAFAYEHCAPAALGLAILYFWMLYCQAAFVQKLRGEISGEIPAPSSALLQFALQSTKFVLLPLALLTLLPYAGVYAFYQNLMAAPKFDEAKKQARLWAQQNWIVLGILALCNLVVFLNIAAALLYLPYLVKMFLGIESVYTRSGSAMFNTTFFAVAISLTYLAVNPLAKAVYLLRCYYGESVETGDDLRTELMHAVRVLILIVALAAIGQRSSAQQRPASETRVEALDRAIEDVIHRPEFTWRLPRAERPPANNQNWFIRTTESIFTWVGKGLKQIGRWFEQFMKWLGDKLRAIFSTGNGGSGPDSRKLRIWMLALLAAVAGILGWLLWSTLRNRKRRRVGSAIAVAAPVIELNDVDLQADQQPVDQWLQLARECIGRREFRLALRAMYLGGLASLADRSLISIHRGKSNLDYARELKRKAWKQPELTAVFTENLGVFERSWYGMYDVDETTIERFESNLSRMRTNAE
jgi:hypothetical protein